MTEHTTEIDETTYCGAELGEVREGECECPRCRAAYPDPLQDWPMPGHLRSGHVFPPAKTVCEREYGGRHYFSIDGSCQRCGVSSSPGKSGS